MDKKAFELAISTLILILIGVLVLIAVAYALTDGFKKFRSATETFTDLSQTNAVKQTCQDACQNNIKLIYCCSEYGIDSETVKCNDTRLEVPCPAITCEPAFCQT